jgi:integrase
MAKRPSLTKQIVDVLNSLARFGESKYEAKQQAISATKAAGIMGWNPARVEGIYSISTMKTYRKESIYFANWVRQKYPATKWLHDARQFVGEYLQSRIEKGDSAWTIQMTRSTLRKLYQEPNLADEIKLPIRRKNEIKRSRGPKAMDKKFSVKRNRDLVDFCRATGLRRRELKELRVDHVYRADDRLMVFVEQGKGGRPRTVPVLRALEGRVLEIISGKKSEQLVIEKIPVRADIHGYRREYANTLYEEWADTKYDSDDKNEEVMLAVSAALGHNRLDVVCRNYLGQLGVSTVTVPLLSKPQLKRVFCSIAHQYRTST